MDGRPQSSYYASQPAEKVTQHMEQSGKPSQRYSTVTLILVLLPPTQPFILLKLGKWQTIQLYNIDHTKYTNAYN